MEKAGPLVEPGLPTQMFGGDSLAFPEPSALIVVLAEESLRRGRRAFAVARSAIDRPHDELADIWRGGASRARDTQRRS